MLQLTTFILQQPLIYVQNLKAYFVLKTTHLRVSLYCLFPSQGLKIMVSPLWFNWTRVSRRSQGCTSSPSHLLTSVWRGQRCLCARVQAATWLYTEDPSCDVLHHLLYPVLAENCTCFVDCFRGDRRRLVVARVTAGVDSWSGHKVLKTVFLLANLILFDLVRACRYRASSSSCWFTTLHMASDGGIGKLQLFCIIDRLSIYTASSSESAI